MTREPEHERWRSISGYFIMAASAQASGEIGVGS